MGTSLDGLREFPKDARQDTGFQLEQVQLGRDPDHWKPTPTVGAGCREIRISTGDGIFRVFYVTQFGDEILCPALLHQEDAEDLEEGYRHRRASVQRS